MQPATGYCLEFPLFPAESLPIMREVGRSVSGPSGEGVAMDCPNTAKNLAHCNCSYEPCARKGICCECIAYHRRRNELPACYFDDATEKSWDRSMARFIRRQG